MMKIFLFVYLFTTFAISKEAQIASLAEHHLWEVRTAPIAMLASWYTLDVSYRTNKNFAFGPAAIIYNSNATQGSMLMPTYKGSALGGHVYYYFNSVYRSDWYLGARLYKESYRSYPHAFLGYDEMDGYKGNATIGYQLKTSEVNWMFGVGGEQREHDVITYEENKSPVTSKESFLGMLIEFKVGFEF